MGPRVGTCDGDGGDDGDERSYHLLRLVHPGH